MEKQSLRILANTEYSLWNEFLDTLEYANVFQAVSYLEALKVNGWHYEVVVNEDPAGSIISGAIIQLKTLIGNRYAYAAINYGPLSRNHDSGLEPIIDYLRQKKCKILDLMLLSGIDINSVKGLKYKHTGNNYTYLLDLLVPYEKIFTNFSHTHRNCARKGKKEGVEITFSTDQSIIPLFLTKYMEMASRKSLKAITPSLMQAIVSNLLSTNNGFFAVASFKEVVYEIAFVSTAGKSARYLYGASSKQPKGTPPIGQYLHEQIIVKLQAEGYSTYDLGGIVSEVVPPEDETYGVWKFKKGFGGKATTMTANYRVFLSGGLSRLISPFI